MPETHSSAVELLEHRRLFSETGLIGLASSANTALLSADRQQIVADASRLKSDRAAGQAKVATDRATLKAALAADRAVIHAAQFRLHADMKARNSAAAVDRHDIIVAQAALASDAASGSAAIARDAAAAKAVLAAEKSSASADNAQFRSDRKSGFLGRVPADQRAGIEHLLTDLAGLVTDGTIPLTLVMADYNDLAAALRGAHAPTKATVDTLAADFQTAAGSLSSGDIATLLNDLNAVFLSAGVTASNASTLTSDAATLIGKLSAAQRTTLFADVQTIANTAGI